MPFEKLAARAFGFSPPVPVSKKSAKFSFHCRSDRRQHDVGTFNICPMAKEDALRLIAPAFAVEELTNRRGDMQLGCVHPQQIDFCDRGGPRRCYADVRNVMSWWPVAQLSMPFCGRWTASHVLRCHQVNVEYDAKRR
jgi:hypothetical protein